MPEGIGEAPFHFVRQPGEGAFGHDERVRRAVCGGEFHDVLEHLRGLQGQSVALEGRDAFEAGHSVRISLSHAAFEVADVLPRSIELLKGTHVQIESVPEGLEDDRVAYGDLCCARLARLERSAESGSHRLGKAS